MKNGIKLSIMVPVYNVEPYIRKSLDSVINQTYKNLEIILVDDGSTDGSGKICDEYAVADSRIKVIHKENGGIVSARKAAIMAATGEYTINFDPDDWIESDAYEKIVEKLEKYHPDMLAFGMTKEFSDFTEKYSLGIEEGFYSADEFWNLFNKSVKESLFFKQPIDMSQCDKAIRTEIIRKHQMNCIETIKKNVDDAVIFPCLLDIDSVYVDSGCWYHYCVRKTSILWKAGEEDFERFLRLSRYLLLRFGESKNKDKVIKEFMLYKILHHLILDLPEKMFLGEKCLIYPQVKKNDNILVYGKGVFANRMIARIGELGYCNIVDNIDSKDVERLRSIDSGSYDYIVVAVFNSGIVSAILNTLEKYDIPKEKIIIIDKCNMTIDMLPDEIRDLYEQVIG